MDKGSSINLPRVRNGISDFYKYTFFRNSISVYRK